MCGIVGYAGEEKASDFLVEGLKKLEYRGYDSAGIAVCCKDGIKIEKTKGRLSELEGKLECDGAPDGSVGIGHTRWATHGEPSDVNSHPHSTGRVTLVHNGIIENYMSLKSTLIADGRVFLSETDTEVATHLIDYYYEKTGTPEDALFSALGRIKGSYALAVIFQDYPETIYAVRKDSPLIIGIGEGENYIASDIPAILSHTKKYYLIEENELVTVTKDSIRIVGFDKKEIKKEIFTADWDVEAAEKSGFPHFMLKEIYEQPRTLAATISPRIKNGLAHILEEEISDTTSIKKIIIVACGSAMHAGLLGEYAIEKLARVPVEVYIASEFRYRNPIFEEGDVVLLISQSGETADSLAALRLAKQNNVPVYAIVNVVGSSIAREADKVLYTWAGPEIAVATTKAYTAQVAVLYLFAIRLAYDKGKMSETEGNRLVKELQKLPDAVSKVLENKEIFQNLASYNQNVDDLFFIGRGQDYALCCEASLKLKEISYMHSEAYAAGELKHGTISLISDGTPVVAVATEEALKEKTISNIKEVKARGAFVLYVCRENSDVHEPFYDKLIPLPAIEEMFMPIVAIAALQSYAYYTAVDKGCDVDKPRNLAKSVTVE